MGRVCAVPGWASSHLVNTQSNSSLLEHDRALPNPVASPRCVMIKNAPKRYLVWVRVSWQPVLTSADSFPEAYVANGEKNPELQKGLEHVCYNKVIAEMMYQGNMVI